jgi:hypothetical protein
MAVLEIQGLGEVEVGDEFLNLSPAEQQSFVDQVYSENVGAAPEEGGFFDRAGDVIEAGGRQFVGSTAEGAAALLDLADMAPETQRDLQAFADKQSREASKIEGVKPLLEAEGIGDVGRSALEYMGMNLPNIGATVAAGKAGALIGSPLGLPGALGGWLVGAGSSIYLQQLGENIQEIEQTKGRPATEEEKETAAKTAIGQAASGAIFSKVAFAKGKPQEIQRSLLSAIARRGTAGAAVEAPTEVFEEGLRILQANDFDLDVLNTPQAQYRLTEAGLAAGTVGGGFGGLGGAFNRPVTPKTNEELASAIEAQSLEGPTRLTEAQVVEQLAEENPTLKQVSDEFLSLQQDTGESPTLTSYIDDLNSRRKQLKADVNQQTDPALVDQLNDQISQLNDTIKAAKDARTLAAQRLNIDANDITLGEMRDNRLVGDLSSRDGLWSGITRYYAQALAPVLPAAEKNQTIRDSVGLLTGTAPAVKARQTPILRTLFNIQSDVGKRLKLPIFSGPVARRTNKILTEIKINDDSRLGQDINRAKADEVFKKYGVSKRRREDLYDAANRIKKEVYDAGFMEGVKDGVLTEDQYVTGYVSMPKNWLSSERKREKAARAFAKEPDITLKQAQDIVQHMYNKATATDNDNFSASDYLSGADFAQGIFTTPGLAKNRTLPKRLNDRLVTEGLSSPDIFRSGMNYVQQVTHAAEMKRRFGDKIDGKNQFKQVIESVIQQNPNDKEIETAGKRLLDLHSSLLGRYNPRDVSPTGRKQISRLLTAEYIATLGLAGITSLVEPLVLLSRVGPGVFIASLTDGLRVMGRKMVRDIFPRFSRSELEKEFESTYYGLPGIIAERYQASAAVDVNNLLSEKFFLTNGLTQVTQFGRSVGFFAAKRTVNRNLRILASPDASARSKRTAKVLLSEMGIRDTSKITQEQLDTSLIRFVDQNMMTPDPLNRPLWMNDPSLAWAGQLMSFMRVFSNEVLSRAAQNIFRGKTQEGIPLGSAERLKRTFQYVVMATLLTGSTGFLQVFKDSLKGYEDGEVPEPDEPNFWVKAFTTAGLTGPFDQIANAIMAPQYGISPLASFLGPVGADFERVFKAFNRFLTTGDTMGFSREVVRHMPFLGNLKSDRDAATEALNNLIKRDRSYADQIMIDLIEKMEDEGIDLDINLDIDF